MIAYYTEGISFTLKEKRGVTRWIKETIRLESNGNRVVGDINIIFCDDEYLLGINREFLSHDYYTDVITFDYSQGKRIDADIFISIDTVRKNSKEYSQSFDKELLRVIIHGVLHLLGYNDTSSSEQSAMTLAEERALSILYNE